MGMLGSVLAGAAKGYLGSRIESIEKQEAYDLKRQLMEAEADMKLRLEEAGYTRNKERTAAEETENLDKYRSRRAEIEGPDANAGGYETDEMKRDSLIKRRDKARELGYLDHAKVYENDLAGLDKAALAEKKLAVTEEIARLREPVYQATVKNLEARADLAEANARKADRPGSGEKGPTRDQEQEDADTKRAIRELDGVTYRDGTFFKGGKRVTNDDEVKRLHSLRDKAWRKYNKETPDEYERRIKQKPTSNKSSGKPDPLGLR